MKNVFDKNELKRKCLKSRELMYNITYNCGVSGAHIGGGLSLVEIMTVLYNNILNIDKMDPFDDFRDRLILSKGHGALAMYISQYISGYIKYDELMTYKKNGSFYSVHPQKNQEKFIEFSSGSLGQGISLGVGVALALKLKNNLTSKVFVILGDGECNEGQVWEAAESSSHFKLNNLVVIIDKNDIQNDNKTEIIMSNSPFKEKWESFGFDTIEIDGHNVEDVYNALIKESQNKPICIIANTVKGKGLSVAENNPEWHNHSLSKEQFDIAIKELQNDKY